ncbi:hypothetical protein E3O53_01220 [Cryobacterium sp. TMT2-18-3]|uniref:TY-Chap2 family putative peptide chaperone n=1 Tax=unclassified Cryobacterium TaxID=2649013 RepID=UPI00106B4AF4|nr:MULTISPECIES: hypothetical protein [unclassified Cryobacterium]TFC26511.1 hypothetical protein E3O22_12890 [Cryobacterium sp. TMT2-18-2]TFC68066.1 hypothetical protein E3O53_01220 [Cryobacterium sp. TMT2-18-3]
MSDAESNDSGENFLPGRDGDSGGDSGDSGGNSGGDSGDVSGGDSGGVSGSDSGDSGGVGESEVDGYEVYNPPADRFLTAQMWWIASELVRRHPHLRISGVEVDEADRLLIVHDEQDGMSVQWDLEGGCKFLVNGVVQKISWIQMLAALNPHTIVKRIEVATGLGIPKTTPATSARALTYRVIASALATATNDRYEWYAVPAPMLHDEDPENPGCEFFRDFPSTVRARAEYVAMTLDEFEAGGRSVYFFQPFWALLRDLEPIAIFDSAGVVHTTSGATALMPLYERLDRKLALVTAHVLADYFP